MENKMKTQRQIEELVVNNISFFFEKFKNNIDKIAHRNGNDTSYVTVKELNKAINDTIENYKNGVNNIL